MTASSTPVSTLHLDSPIARLTHPQEYASSISSRCPHPPSGIDAPARALHVAWLSDSTAAVALQNGMLLTLQLVGTAGAVRSISLVQSGTAPPLTCLVALSPELLFLGTYVADSLLVQAVKVRMV